MQQQEIWFQKYRIIRPLGRGGNSKVFLSEHIKLNLYRVIKCISKSHPFYDNQLQEAQILKNLKHSCIPIIYDIEEDEDSSYIVEQYLEGVTLRDYIEIKGTIPENIIIHFTLQLCDLIHYLHHIERPILYLDLKPENIIICGLTLKLVDFGSALYRDDIKEEQGFYGTRGYAAPELYRKEKIDERCDVYSIGMLLYYMITGISPGSGMADLDNIDFIENCPRYLKRVINRCLKFNPSQRYVSVTQLSKQLSAVRDKNLWVNEPGPSIRFAVAGAQPRIGVTHLSFRLSSYLIQKGISCMYREKNDSGCIRRMKSRYDGLDDTGDALEIESIPVLGVDHEETTDMSKYRILIDDYGKLTKDNLKLFLEADVKILLLGAKDWELMYSEQVLEMVAEYKDIIYLFNYLNGKQYQQVMKHMFKRNCYRIPYEPNPFAKVKKSNDLEFIKELIRASEG